MCMVKQVQPLLDGCTTSSPPQKESMLESAKDLAGAARAGRRGDRKRASKLGRESSEGSAQLNSQLLLGSSPPQLPAALPSPGTLLGHPHLSITFLKHSILHSALSITLGKHCFLPQQEEAPETFYATADPISNMAWMYATPGQSKCVSA